MSCNLMDNLKEFSKCLKQYFVMQRRECRKAVEATARDFAHVRTGRASASLLDNIHVDYYGTKSPINQVATITIPEPRLIVIQPWDKTVMKDVERAIAQSDLGLEPEQ